MLRKIIFIFFLTCLMTLNSTNFASASNPISVYLNGNKLAFDVPPLMINNRVLTPIRSISEALNAVVSYDPNQKKVTIYHHDTETILLIEQNTAYVNGKPIQLDVPTKIINNRVLVPLRFVANLLEVKVVWNQSFQAVEIYSQIRIALYYPKITPMDYCLVREVHTIPYTKEVTTAALQELISGTPQTDGALKFLPSNTKILGIKINNGLASVDFSPEVLNANVGASLEMLGIQSIVNTLTQFSTVHSVMFLVNGQVDEAIDWWGHVGLYEQPFYEDLSSVSEPVFWLVNPSPGQLISSPLTIKGSTLVNETNLSFRLVDQKGNLLGSSYVDAFPSTIKRGFFSTTLRFIHPYSEKVFLQVYLTSSANNTDKYSVIIPLNI